MHAQKFYMAPLQGYTDKAYRKTYHNVFGNIDAYYTPYLSVGKNGKIQNTKDIVGISSELHEKTVPQILVADIDELKMVLKTKALYDYKRVNLNLGCPYPMVTNRGRGAALLQKPDVVSDIVNWIVGNSDFEVSLKVRAGLTCANEVFELFGRIPLDKIDHAIIHPRIAKQLYLGKADVEIAKKLQEVHPDIKMVYNGDIFSFSHFQQKQEVLTKQTEWMFGRGLLQNPFLVEQITKQSDKLPDGYGEKLRVFASELAVNLEADSNDAGHALNRMKVQLVYMLENFVEFKKNRKRIKKARSINEVRKAIDDIGY